MYKLLSKYGLFISIGTAAFLLLIAYIVYAVNGEAYIVTQDGIVIDNSKGLLTLNEGDEYVGSVSGLFSSGYILIVLALLTTLLIFPIKTFKESPKKLIGAGAGVVIIGLCYIIFSSIADTQLTQILQDMETPPSEGDMKFTGGILGTCAAFTVLGVLSLIGSEIYKIVK